MRFGFLGALYGRMGVSGAKVTVNPAIIVDNLSIPIGAAINSAVGTASINVSFTSTASWTLANSAGGVFKINNTSGGISVNSAATLASSSSYGVTIAVSGTTPDPGDLATRIYVVPAAATLSMTSASDTGSSSTDGITANTTPGFTVNTTLYEGEVVQFYDSGVLFLSHALTSAEASSKVITALDSGISNATHLISAQVNNGGYLNAASNSVSVTVDTVGPTITNSTTGNVDENATLSFSLTASETATWAIAGGADSTSFEISSTTLRWASNGFKDFEAPDDANTDNQYAVQVRATDVAGNSTVGNVTITVNNTSDALSISLNSSTIAEAASINSAVGTASLVGSYTSTTVVWSLTNSAAGVFKVNSTTGLLMVNSAEGLASHSSFGVTIGVSGTTPDPSDLSATIYVIPTKAIIDLINASDTGLSSTDNITSATDPTLDFTATLYEGDVIRFYDNGVQVGSPHSVTAQEVLDGEINLGGTLADGDHPLTATIARGGVENTASDQLTITVDTASPSLTSATASATGSTTASFQVFTNEATSTTGGIVYWVMDQTSTTPTKAQVVAGQDGGGNAADKSGSQTVTASPVAASTTGLSASTTYYTFFTQVDAAGNSAAVSSATGFATNSSGGSASAAFTNFAARCSTAGVPLAGADATNYQNLLDGLTTDNFFNSSTGVSTVLDALYILAAPSSTVALLNLASSTYGLTANGGPTFVSASGYTGADASTTKYLQTNFNPTTAASPNLTSTSVHLACWSLTNSASGASGGGAMGYQGSGANNILHLIPRYNGNVCFYRANDVAGATSSVSGVTDSMGHFCTVRNSAGGTQVYRNSSSIGISSESTGTLQNLNIVLLAQNDNGSVALGSGLQYAAFHFGAKLTGTQVTNIYNRLSTYMTANGH